MVFEFLSPDKYGTSINFALTFMTLVWNIILLSRIHYTATNISKLTLRPYSIALCYLITKQAGDVYYLLNYVNEIYYPD